MGEVLTFDPLDKLRRQSRAHNALCKIYGDEVEKERAKLWADYIMEKLWKAGFKIVPRDDGDFE